MRKIYKSVTRYINEAYIHKCVQRQKLYRTEEKSNFTRSGSGREKRTSEAIVSAAS